MKYSITKGVYSRSFYVLFVGIPLCSSQNGGFSANGGILRRVGQGILRLQNSRLREYTHEQHSGVYCAPCFSQWWYTLKGWARYTPFAKFSPSPVRLERYTLHFEMGIPRCFSCVHLSLREKVYSWKVKGILF